MQISKQKDRADDAAQKKQIAQLAEVIGRMALAGAVVVRFEGRAHA